VKVFWIISLTTTKRYPRLTLACVRLKPVTYRLPIQPVCNLIT
jgi:hypothetical protein